MKRILLFAFSVLLLLSPASLLAQGGPSIKPGQLQTKPAIPLPPNKDLEGLGEKIREQEATFVQDVQECLDFYSGLEAFYNSADSSYERFEEGSTCRCLSADQLKELDFWAHPKPPLIAKMFACKKTPSSGPDSYYGYAFLSHDLGSCPRLPEDGPSQGYYRLTTGSACEVGEGFNLLCVVLTELHEAVAGCTAELSRHSVTVPR